MPYTIQILDETLCLMNADGFMEDAAPLRRHFAAKRHVQRWALEYTLDVAAAYRTLRDHFVNS